jgi:hypothetical protein
MPWKVLVGKRPFGIYKGSYELCYGICLHREKQIWINDEYLYRNFLKPDDWIEGESLFVSFFTRIYDWILIHTRLDRPIKEYIQMTPDERFYSTLNHELYHVVKFKRGNFI